jgi:hypothetical protein
MRAKSFRANLDRVLYCEMGNAHRGLPAVDWLWSAGRARRRMTWPKPRAPVQAYDFAGKVSIRQVPI